MDDLQVDVRERKTQGRESILTRREILAPPGYVRFYHETKAEFLTAIDKEGLRAGIEKNLGSPDQVTRRNMIMDEVRPPRLVAGGDLKTRALCIPSS
ncbi:MAG: hypothetical protein UZ21_OP11001000589 [Microgenomates bacterium OLB22]|nr:MAG: hypothetical protein UZ21_OP11001000589 [Microgenomates bacterium OLB22]